MQPRRYSGIADWYDLRPVRALLGHTAWAALQKSADSVMEI